MDAWYRKICFCHIRFLIAQTFICIKNNENKITKHLKFYILLAILSELGYDLMMQYKLDTWKVIFLNQSVMLTLIIGFLTLYFINELQNKLYSILIIICSFYLVYLTKSDYGISGIVLIVCFYCYLNYYTKYLALKRLFLLISIMIVFVIFYHLSIFNCYLISDLIASFTLYENTYYPFYFLIPFLLMLYNGKLGYKNLYFKNLYRYFYPAHLFIIGLTLFIYDKV
ncbi:TraX family protein [Campylobacter hyointestinalis]|uniref:TraX family protein n=1 Tax=Campylobacter hyointestinalis TaxID=198 RepID=UPI003D7F353A